MKKKWATFNILIFSLSIFVFSGAKLHAQKEILVGTTHNQENTFEQNKQAPFLKIQSSDQQDTINVPFIEDFAKSVGYPHPDLWADNLAFINHQYSNNPVSIGVATLDAINAKGDIYQNGNSSGFSADTLTSKPINLNFSPEDNIYLSFYYQPGGLGDSPEFSDSLVVQFYNPDSLEWKSVWNVAVFQDTIHIEKDIRNQKTDSVIVKNAPFRQVNLPINQEKYLKKGFQFRFRNYASVSDYTMSLASNVDHWNLDFIRLDTARSNNDTTINDIAFIEPMKPLLNNYESIPWDHWSNANANEMNDSIYITYSNIGDQTWNISREFIITDKMGNNPPFTFTGGTGDDIPPYTKETYPRTVDYIFPENNKDSALYKIKSYLVTDTVSARAPYRWNDTISYNQKFFNYYAYDDGTAENGYGVNGEGSEYSKVALKFHNYKADTLQGLQIFFNQTLDTTGQSFKILIWENDNGQPGDIIHSESGFRQIFEDGVNQFHNYSFNEKPYLEEGDYFVGYQKFTTEMLNVGFDVNRINNDKLFYFVDGQWWQSGYEGTVMMRPILGDYIPPSNDDQTSIEDKKEKELPKIVLYPNPARNHLNIEISDTEISEYSARIYSIQGILVKRIPRLNRTVQIGRLTQGMYVFELINAQNVPVNRKKFMVRD